MLASTSQYSALIFINTCQCNVLHDLSLCSIGVNVTTRAKNSLLNYQCLHEDGSIITVYLHRRVNVTSLTGIVVRWLLIGVFDWICGSDVRIVTESYQ